MHFGTSCLAYFNYFSIFCCFVLFFSILKLVHYTCTYWWDYFSICSCEKQTLSKFWPIQNLEGRTANSKWPCWKADVDANYSTNLTDSVKVWLEKLTKELEVPSPQQCYNHLWKRWQQPLPHTIASKLFPHQCVILTH